MAQGGISVPACHLTIQKGLLEKHVCALKCGLSSQSGSMGGLPEAGQSAWAFPLALIPAL